MQIDTNKTLRQLYEEGVIKIGTRLYMEVPKGRKYVSKEERNGCQNQTFISLDIESEGKYFWTIALEPKNNEMFAIGKPFGHLKLAGAEGFVYGIEELNNICDKMFTTDYLKARSINIDDVNKVLGVEIIDNKDLQIVGPHNMQNVMSAVIVAKILGLDNKTIKNALKTFKAIEHRLEYIRTIDGTDYYNDSKATNPEASIVAINSFKDKKVVLIAGGRDKKTSLKDFIAAVKERISKVVLIGEATNRFKTELAKSGYMSIVNSKTLEEAIDIASLDKPEVVLLSPACASFDMIESYEKRGEAFKNYVLSKK